MRLSPAAALDQLTAALTGREPLDRGLCRRLALRITGRISDPLQAGIYHDALCAIIDAHGADPDQAFERFEFLRPILQGLVDQPH